jgi:hypothetical protein
VCLFCARFVTHSMPYSLLLLTPESRCDLGWKLLHIYGEIDAVAGATPHPDNELSHLAVLIENKSRGYHSLDMCRERCFLFVSDVNLILNFISFSINGGKLSFLQIVYLEYIPSLPHSAQLSSAQLTRER